MESLANMVNGTNGIFVLGLLLILIVIVIALIKKGKFSFSGHGLSIGGDEQERKIMRQQSEYLTMVADSTIRYLPKHFSEGPSYYRTKYVISKFKDIFEAAIMYNHITDDDEYIQLKQEMAYSMILKVTEDDFFKKEEFKKYVYELVEKIIRRFVKIRKEYSH